MQPPRFWDNPPDTARMAGDRARASRGAVRGRDSEASGAGHRAIVPPVPVVCVGNLNAGGTGKTPTVIALVERCLAAGRKPQVVSRGHGGRLEGPVRVDPHGTCGGGCGGRAAPPVRLRAGLGGA